jgi:hypothetical protein
LSVGLRFGKQQHPWRASDFSQESAIQPPRIAFASCAFHAAMPSFHVFFQSASSETRSRGLDLQQSPCVLSVHAKVSA